MVAIFHQGQSLNKAVSYNENKVREGRAAALLASGYAKDLSLLSFHDKLFQLQQLAALNKRVSTNTVHISLNFDLSEQLSKELLEGIAQRYMDGIGFGGQPYLVYQHFDSGHPHIHIVSTNIQADGSRISLHNIGRNQSEEARKEIEKDFGLVPAGGRQREQYRIQPIGAAAIQYGKTETTKAISEVVTRIINTYKFTSIAELNIILKPYNVIADRGKKEGFMYRHSGLQYRVLDASGNKTGVPIKASTVTGKPTLKVLERKFQLNELLRNPHKQKISAAIDNVLNKGKCTRQQFEKYLSAKNIQVVFRQNDSDRIYGVTYIDHTSKCVFNGSDLGKEYSANAIVGKLTMSQDTTVQQKPSPGIEKNIEHSSQSRVAKIVKQLFDPTSQQNQQSPLPKKRKKKKRRGPDL